MTRLHLFSVTALVSVALSGGVLLAEPAYAATSAPVSAPASASAATSASASDVPRGPAGHGVPSAHPRPGHLPHDFGWQ
ncbi:hypothetical protein [Streptomyces sp. AC1-42W]|uniref:hypothetical protein n=1 Tax=Streptomyces sp. AC1-42W TaxID=2218666 RepID=UPI0013148D0B|nr:hypothetical protein [Streptomyces sp. AC1-42W]